MKVSLILCTVFVCGLYFTDATICKPDSTFKIDCNLCHCSQNGRSYSCTDHLCPPPDSVEFTEEELPNGFILLKPKVQSAERVNDDDDSEDFVLTREQRNGGRPYINDEIPSSHNKADIVPNWDRSGESENIGTREAEDSWESAAYDFVKKAILEE